LARRLGGTDEQLAALATGDGSAFEPAWSAALDYAAEATRAGGAVADATFDTLRAHWTQSQIVEITAVIGLFNLFNRFANALEIPPTR
jgi:alkylhydroperoxidase family enzyme